MKDHHDQLFVIDQEATQNSQVFSQTANGSFLCHDTVPAEFFTKIINIKDGSGRFVKEDIKEEESSTTKGSRRDQGQPRESSLHTVKQEALETRQLGGITSKAEIQKENRSSESYVQCNKNIWKYERNRFRTLFCKCGKTLGGLTALHEKNAQVTIEKGSHVIQSLVKLRIVEQVWTTPRYIRRSKVSGIDVLPFSEYAQEKESLTQSTNKRRYISKVVWSAGKTRRVQKADDITWKYTFRKAEHGGK